MSIEFKNIGELVNKVNIALGQFCDEFGRKRKELAGLGRVPKRGILFKYEDESRNWAINEGGGTEIQYHIAFDADVPQIVYGLGFNTQRVQFKYAMTEVEYMKPFMDSFLNHQQEIRQILPDYDFVYGSLNSLQNPKNGEYTLFGKTLEVTEQNSKYYLEDTAFDTMTGDLQKQFEAYQIIFLEKNNYKKVAMNILKSIEILTSKGQIILQGPPGTGKTYTAKDLAEQIIFGTVSEDKKAQKTKLQGTEQFRLIQFHPAYTYEDFVRGIIVKTENSTIPEYKTVNKILGEFAKKANESNLAGGTDDFERAWLELAKDIDEGVVTKIGSSKQDVEINSQGNFTFKTVVATYNQTYELYRFGKTDLKYDTYNKIVLKYLKDQKGKYKLKDYVAPKPSGANKPFVLIVDEINRANLPAVLGELIYALEYRGEQVESMYATIEEGNKLILPPNLYIIGTMNTSDRSVGHIDYAIRRRFAFIDVLPKILPGDAFQSDLFKQVSSLFIANFDEYEKDDKVELKLSEHLSEEFRPEDVWLGHSYFLKGTGDFELRKKYEIVPILKEYVKDGILKQSALPIINSL